VRVDLVAAEIRQHRRPRSLVAQVAAAAVGSKRFSMLPNSVPRKPILSEQVRLAVLGELGLVARQVRSAEIQHSAAPRLLSILLTVVVAADPVQLLFNRVAAAAVAWPALVASARLAR
jgi:hypothetical protein